MTTFDKNSQLNTMPHYTDSRFKTEQTVFGKEQKGLSYNYSDMLWEWDYNKAKQATDIANQSGHIIRSCLWYEVYLSAYFDKPIVIEHILAGVNRSNGYPYCVFGYKSKE